MSGFFTGNNIALDFESKLDEPIMECPVLSVDAANQTMKIQFPRTSAESDTIPIANQFVPAGQGFRFIPAVNGTHVIVYNGPGVNRHLAYSLSNITDVSDDASGDKQEGNDTRILLRYMDPGETQMLGLMGNEVFLSIDGDVLIKNQFNSQIKLNNYLSRYEGNYANLLHDMDRVRIRAGNIIRPTRIGTTDDQYMVANSDGDIFGVDELESGDEYTALKEFTIQVGTEPDPENKYRDFVNPIPYLDSPYTGIFSIADVIVRENGNGLFAGGEPVLAMLRVGTGDTAGGFEIGADGAFSIMDYSNFSATKFSSTDKTLRIKQSYISVTESIDSESPFETEILIRHESNAGISLTDGNVVINERAGRNITLDPYGIQLDASGALIKLQAQDIAFVPDGGCVSIGALPTDGVIKATYASVLFDTHTHAGPMGPPLPAFWWTPQKVNPLFMAQNLKVM